MAFNPTTDEFRDPFDGQRDLEQRWIKAVGDSNLRFREDALRILRAIRFQSQFGCSIEEEPLQAMADSSSLMNTLSRERIQVEITKWLLGDHFSMTQETARRIDLFQIFEIPPQADFYKNWDLIGAASPTLLFRLSAFLDLYVGQSNEPVRTDNCLKLLKSLKYGQQVISKVIQFIEFLSKPYDVDTRDTRLICLKRALEIGFGDAILLLQWKVEQSANKLLYLKEKDFLMKLQQNGFEQRVYPLALGGKQVMDILNLEQGPKVKIALDDLQNAVLENPDLNTAAELEKYLHKK